MVPVPPALVDAGSAVLVATGPVLAELVVAELVLATSVATGSVALPSAEAGAELAGIEPAGAVLAGGGSCVNAGMQPLVAAPQLLLPGAPSSPAVAGACAGLGVTETAGCAPKGPVAASGGLPPGVGSAQLAHAPSPRTSTVRSRDTLSIGSGCPNRRGRSLGACGTARDPSPISTWP
jgi:hypothetical protein